MVNFTKFIKNPKVKLSFNQINMHRIKSIISKMNSGNSFSRDKLTGNIIKKCRESISPLILNIVNNVSKARKIPISPKISKIIPIFKNNLDDTDLNNLRPISIISPLSKIIVKVWYENIMKHMQINDLIPQGLQGGIKGRSSNILNLDILQFLNKIKSNKGTGAIAALDQSSAYNVVSHFILKKKLKAIGIEDTTVELIIDYLSNINKYVRY